MRRTYIECGGFSSQLQKKDVVTKSEDPENVVSQTSELFVTKSEWEKYLKRQGLEGTGPDGSDPTVDYMANLWYKYIKYKGYEGTKDELEDFYRWHKQGELWVEHTRDTWERIRKICLLLRASPEYMLIARQRRESMLVGRISPTKPLIARRGQLRMRSPGGLARSGG